MTQTLEQQNEKKMTVSELINKLKNVPQDYNVIFREPIYDNPDDYGELFAIENVELSDFYPIAQTVYLTS